VKKQNTIIIKKINKGGHGGAHGGSWKVAYADFVTAMMAFFLLLWLISMVSPEKRARVSAYFKYFSIYDQSGSSFMNSSSEIFSESGESSQKAFTSIREKNIQNMQEQLKKGIIGKLEDAKDQIVIDTVEGGVRIQMTDKDGSLMFETGSNKLTPEAKQILSVIGDNINKLPNKISVEGHTDSLQYAGNDYSNWELSTERASSARRELEANGLNARRIDRVSGYADKDPLIKDNPEDPRNRRISIIVKVPYFEETKPDAKAVSQRSSEILPENKDEKTRTVILNKFEENLSLVKSGMNAAGKNKEVNTVNKKGDGLPAQTKEIVGTEKKEWGAVIKKEDWSPVIKDDLKPVMTHSPSVNTDVPVPEQKPDRSTPVLRNLQIPESKDTSKPAIREVEKSTHDYLIKSSKTKKTGDTTSAQNDSAPALNEQSKDAEKKTAVIKELSVPVISTDELFKK